MKPDWFSKPPVILSKYDVWAVYAYFDDVRRMVIGTKAEIFDWAEDCDAVLKGDWWQYTYYSPNHLAVESCCFISLENLELMASLYEEYKIHDLSVKPY